MEELDEQKADEASGGREAPERKYAFDKFEIRKKELEQQNPTMIFEVAGVQQVLSGIPSSLLSPETLLS